MKNLKWSGREASVLRAIDFATGTLGAEVVLKTRIEPQDTLDILNSLLDGGFLETNPPRTEPVEMKAFYNTVFEVNPAYAHELRKSLVRF